MTPTYAGHGLKFAYPEGWQVEESKGEGSWSVLVQSPGTAFMQLVGQRGGTAEEVLQSAVAVLREDYPDLEAESVIEKLAGQEVPGEDVTFISLDLTASCFLRALSLPEQLVLVLCQTSDLELEVMEPVLRAMRLSIQLAKNQSLTLGEPRSARVSRPRRVL